MEKKKVNGPKFFFFSFKGNFVEWQWTHIAKLEKNIDAKYTKMVYAALNITIKDIHGETTIKSIH